VPYTAALEAAIVPDPAQIEAAVRAVLGHA
jgi:hypothetical protein